MYSTLVQIGNSADRYKSILFFSSGSRILFFLLLFLLVQANFLSAQITFQRTFQATGMNGGLSLSLTTDGGYVVTGQHESSGVGSCDVYVYKRDACGNTNFFNTYGDGYSQGGKGVKQTADGGFIVAGITQPTGTQELVLMKLDAGGNFQWVRNYGNANDWGMFVQQTTDGGYIVTGGTLYLGTWDVFLLKTDAAGNPQWSEVFTAPGEEFANYVEQTTDGGYFLAGYSQGSVNADADVLAMKTDIAGNVQWSNVYGGNKHDGNARYDGLSLFSTRGQQTPDGGYAIGTSTRSFGVNDSADIWLLKLNSGGGVQWNKTYGGTNNEEARGIHVTYDGGFAIVGWTMSYGFGEQDVYLLSMDSLGNLNWSKTYGGIAREKGESITQSSIDHGYYIDGYSGSFSNFTTFLFDAYALKTDSLGVTGCNETSPVTTVGSGTPFVTPFTYGLTTYPVRPTAAWIQASYNPGEYALCETLPPPDVAQFTNNTVCVGDSTVFTDFSTAGYGVVTEWIWDFGDGSPFDSTQNPAHTYSAAGTYSVTLVIHTTYSCIPDSITQLVTVNPVPLPLFTAPTVCFNNPTIFTDLSTTANGTLTGWNWNFGDGNSDIIQNPSHTYNTSGTFTVTLIVTNSFGCKDTVQQTVLVHPLPVASFSSTTVCFGDTSCFSDLSSISLGSVTAWSWNFGDPNSGASNVSGMQNPCHVFTGQGPYSVLLTVTSDSGCQMNATLPAYINPLPVAAFNAPNVCFNDVAGFTDGTTSASGDPVAAWNWNFGDLLPGTSALQNPSYLYGAPGTYTVTLIVTTAKGCRDTTLNPITIYNNPVAGFSNPDSGCAPLCNVNFSDTSTTSDGTITNWFWSFPGGNPSASIQQNPSGICYNSPGLYDVSLIVMSNYGCKDTLQITQYVEVFALPQAEFCIDASPLSVNEPNFTFCDLWSSDVVQWSWNFGDGSPADSINTDPAHSYSAVATNNDYYYFTVCVYVINNHGCYDSICHVVELLPEFSFYIPNTFTPNGDLDNETFFGKGRGIKDYTIWLFDRWGNLIWDCHYEGKNVNWDNIGQEGMSSACKWDGKVEGGGSNLTVQEDVYVWKVRLIDIFDQEHTYIGHVNVVR